MQARAVDLHAEVRVLAQMVDHVEAEAAHALVGPPADHVIELPPQGGVGPVEVRLLLGELIVVILSDLRHGLPGGPPEAVRPVLRRHRVPPDVVVVSRALAALLRREKPGVLVGAVVEHEIHDDADAAASGLGDEAIHVLHRAEERVHVPVVRDVVAVVVLRRAVHRRQPDRVDPQRLQIVQMREDAGDVADPVAVGVGEAARVDLIDHRPLPPGGVVHGQRPPLSVSRAPAETQPGPSNAVQDRRAQSSSTWARSGMERMAPLRVVTR